jgi:hypothetical protein
LAQKKICQHELLALHQGLLMRFAAIVVCAAIVAAVPGKAMSQAGSTGGTVGKQDKSVSGTETGEPRQSSPKARRQASAAAKDSNEGSCGKFVGTWEWSHIGIVTVVFNADGSASGSNGVHGSWGCSGGVLTVTWSDGLTYRLAISSDGVHFASVANVLGFPISGVRK